MNYQKYIRIIIASILISLLTGCANKEEQKKVFRANVAANYILIVFSTESNFGLIGQMLDGWQKFGIQFANNLKYEKSDFTDIDQYIGKIRETKEADIELYMAVLDLYDTAVKVDSLKTSTGGYSLLTYVAKAKSLKEDWDVKKTKLNC